MSDNIVGKDHLDYVKNQITARQEILGKFNKDSEDIVWQDNRNSWIRLMSSVNIADEDILIYNETTQQDEIISNNGAEFRNQYLELDGYGGPKLSQELILQGGTLNYNEPKFGITDNTSTSPESNFNYGFGGNQFGQKPIPGITSFSSNTYNKGSLRKAQLQIIAHNSKQFNYIESIYLRLGYTMLLEWGNTKYPIANEDGSTRYSTPSDIAALSLKDEFLYSYDKGSSYFYTRIEELRKTSQGNYDGFLGRVENFSWEFTKDGSYSITLDLISIGSVVESLKINTNLDSIFYISRQQGTDVSSPEEERPSALEAAIDMLANTQVSYKESEASVKVEYSQAVKEIAEDYEKYLGLSTKELNPNNYVISLNASYGGSGVVGKSDVVFENITYLRLGTLLDFINKKLLLYNKNLNPSVIEIDTSIDTYCYSNRWSFSGNPKKMVNKLFKDNNLWSSDTTGDPDISIFPLAENFHDTIEDNIPVGRVMNLYFSRDYLVETIKEQTNEEGDLILFDFLKAILNTANSLLGNVNKLNLRIVDKEFRFTQEEIPQAIDIALITEKDITPNEDGTFSIIKQVIEIYDEVRIKKIDTNPIFNIFGFNPNESKTIKEEIVINDSGETQTFNSPLKYNGGSFITDFNLKTEITKKLATQIAIGAQANGSTAGKDATLFSKWNVGLIDRVIPSKLDIDKASRDTAQSYIDFLKLKNLYLKYLKFLYDSKTSTLIADPQNISSRIEGNKTIITTAYTFPSVYLSSTSDEKPLFLKFETIQQQFFQKILSYDAERKSITNPFIGFIPINLSLTMDGLSGIRIFDKLTLRSGFLPSNYTETLDFIITQLDHKFEGEKWITNIGTLSMPKLFNKRAEVILDEYLNIEELKKGENRIYENSENFPSYFYIKPEVVIGVRKGTTGKRDVNIDELLTYLNDSDFVQSKFRKFFNDLLDLFPTGYQFTINSIVRKLDTVTGVGLNSEHIWGLSIDMAVREAKPDGGFSQNILYGLEQTPEGQSKWNSTDIPRIASAAGLRWGGNWTTGGWKYDTVHFGAMQGWDAYKTLPQDLLFGVYPRLKTLIQGAIDGSERNAKNVISGLDLTNFLNIEEKDGNLVITVDISRDGELAILNGIRFMRANGGQIISEDLIK